MKIIEIILGIVLIIMSVVFTWTACEMNERGFVKFGIIVFTGIVPAIAGILLIIM